MFIHIWDVFFKIHIVYFVIELVIYKRLTILKILYILYGPIIHVEPCGLTNRPLTYVCLLSTPATMQNTTVKYNI